MSVPIEASGVATRDVTGGVGGRAVGRVGRDARVRRPARVARHAYLGGRISEMLVASVQRLSLSVV